MMDGRRKIITLCGSTRFIEQFNDANFWLTIHGHVVLSLGTFLHPDDDHAIRDIVMARKAQLDELHRYKIDMSDAIMVIDVDGYAGESTMSEVEHAIRKGKPVYSYTQSKSVTRTLSVLVHCDPEKLASWLTAGQTTPPQQQQSLLSNHHYARTNNDNLVPVTASEPRPSQQSQQPPSYHLAAAGPVALPSGYTSTTLRTRRNVATVATQALPPLSSPPSAYSTASMCKHCLHHNNCHYTDNKDGDTHCTACVNTKCRKLADFLDSDDREIRVKIT